MIRNQNLVAERRGACKYGLAETVLAQSLVQRDRIAKMGIVSALLAELGLRARSLLAHSYVTVAVTAWLMETASAISDFQGQRVRTKFVLQVAILLDSVFVTLEFAAAKNRHGSKLVGANDRGTCSLSRSKPGLSTTITEHSSLHNLNANKAWPKGQHCMEMSRPLYWSKLKPGL